MDITDAHLRTNKISWRLAPAASAARMWRRVPSGFRFVRPAFNPTLANSINLMGKIPSIQGFVVIFTHSSAQDGSHSRNRLNAVAQGLAGCSPAKTFSGILFVPLSPFLPNLQTTLDNWMNERS